ncbi:MAG: hypothetical protein WD554_03460 [Flavobacteriaceae bacterium]
MKNKLFISCEEAAHRIDKAQYGETTFWEKLSFNFHNLYCSHCKVYAAINKRLTLLFKSGDVHCLTREQKSKMKEKLADTASSS